MKKFLAHYLPHIHMLFFGVLALVIASTLLVYSKTVINGIREMHCEKKSDGTAGKLSHKRVGLSFILLTMLYGFIYSIHTAKVIDPYTYSVLGILVILGWKLATPAEADGLIDKLSNLKKGLLKSDDSETKNKQEVTATATVTTADQQS